MSTNSQPWATPRGFEESIAAPALAAMNEPHSPLRVLVVDDEPLICWSLAETLAEHGDIVMEAGSGAAALSALSQADEPVDVAILDYTLPDVRNLGLLSMVLGRCPGCRVILMSAFLTPEIAKDALDIGASRVITKPLDMRDVPALVHAVADSRKNKRETPVGSEEIGC